MRCIFFCAVLYSFVYTTRHGFIPLLIGGRNENFVKFRKTIFYFGYTWYNADSGMTRALMRCFATFSYGEEGYTADYRNCR